MVALCASVVSSLSKDPARLVVTRMNAPRTHNEGRFEDLYGQGKRARVCAPCEGKECEREYSFTLERLSDPTTKYQMTVSVEARGPYPEPTGKVRLIVQ